MGPYHYITQLPGKQIRTKLAVVGITGGGPQRYLHMAAVARLYGYPSIG